MSNSPYTYRIGSSRESPFSSQLKHNYKLYGNVAQLYQESPPDYLQTERNDYYKINQKRAQRNYYAINYLTQSPQKLNQTQIIHRKVAPINRQIISPIKSFPNNQEIVYSPIKII